MNTIIQDITANLIPALVTAILPLLFISALQLIAWLRAKVNATNVGAISQIDDIAFDELEAIIKGLKPTADAWKSAASDGKLTPELQRQLRDMAEVKLKENLAHYGRDFATKIPAELINTWITWHVNKDKVAVVKT